ncbi:MAG: c-type cytochrome [Candidatus Sedimenticola sp. (ex Thyasira tokunagai)]
MHIRLLTATAVAALLVVGCTAQEQKKPAAAAKVEKPKLMTGASASMLANTCAGCHGTNGQSQGPAAPTIAGLEIDYFTEVMQDYKSGERSSTIMGRIAKGYSDKEIEQMAGAFNKQTFKGVVQTSVGDKARMGHKLHDKYCEKCHEDGGTSVEDTPLAGQWMPYVQTTIVDYLEGHNSPEKKMTKAIDKMVADHPSMSKAQLAEDLAHYYASHK